MNTNEHLFNHTFLGTSSERGTKYENKSSVVWIDGQMFILKNAIVEVYYCDPYIFGCIYHIWVHTIM